MTEYGSGEKFEPTHHNLVRFGTVVDRRRGQYGPEVRVVFHDRNVTSDWLPIGNQAAAGTGMHYCPRVNDNVTVLHPATGIEQGVVACSTPSANSPLYQPTHLDSIAMASEKGAYFEFEPNSGILTVTGVAELHLVTAGAFLAQIRGTTEETVVASAQVVAAAATGEAGSITLE